MEKGEKGEKDGLETDPKKHGQNRIKAAKQHAAPGACPGAAEKGEKTREKGEKISPSTAVFHF